MQLLDFRARHITSRTHSRFSSKGNQPPTWHVPHFFSLNTNYWMSTYGHWQHHLRFEATGLQLSTQVYDLPNRRRGAPDRSWGWRFRWSHLHGYIYIKSLNSGDQLHSYEFKDLSYTVSIVLCRFKILRT